MPRLFRLVLEVKSEADIEYNDALEAFQHYLPGTSYTYYADGVNPSKIDVVAVSHLGGPDSATKAKFTSRENEVLEALARGHGNKAIANQLELTEGTVKVHFKAIFSKLGVKNRTSAALWAIRNGYGSEY